MTTIRDVDEIPSVEVKSTSTGEIFTLARIVTEGTGISDFSIIHEELLPGRRSSSAHYHSKLDEIYYILSGSPTVVEDSVGRSVSPGSFVVFKAGERKKHFIKNESEDIVQFIRIASCPKDDEVVY